MLRIVAMNLGLGGRATDGGKGRFYASLDLLTALRPTVVCLNEANGWGPESDHTLLAEAQEHTGLQVAGGLTYGRSDCPVAVLYDPKRAAWKRWVTREAAELWHGLGIVSLDVDGLQARLTVISAHFTPFSARAAAAEAQIAGRRVWDYGPLGVIAGDINYLGPEPCLLDPAEVPAHNLGTRWDRAEDGTYTPNRDVVRALAAYRLTDAAWHLYQKSGDERLLARTGRQSRIDAVYTTPALTGAIVHYAAVDNPGSDHRAVLVDLDPARIDYERC